MGGSHQRARKSRRLHHALSVLGQARRFLDRSAGARDVAIKCKDGTFRYSKKPFLNPSRYGKYIFMFELPAEPFYDEDKSFFWLVFLLFGT